MSDMKIEEGKYYRTRDGRKVGPMRRVSEKHRYDPAFVWTCGDVLLSASNLWTRDGYFYKDGEHQDDLVAEWEEPAPGPSLATSPQQPLYLWVNDKIALPCPGKPGRYELASEEAAAAIQRLEEQLRQLRNGESE